MQEKPKEKTKDSSIPIFNWFDEPAKKSILSVFDGINSGVESLDLFKKFRRKQFRIVKSLVSTVKILGMTTPQPLSTIYAPAHVSTSIARRLFSEEWLNAKAPVEAIRAITEKGAILGEKYIEQSERTVVLGGPGSGKTTFLKHLALSYADNQVFRTTKLERSLLPIFVSLPIFAKSGTDLFNYFSEPLIEHTNEYAKNYLIRSLEKGLAILLLDSFDEVPVPNRDATLEAIRKISVRFPDAKIVMTCRTADYEGGLENFSEVEITPLSRTAVQKIIMAWFRDDEQKGSQLLRLLRNDRGVESLTETPLLLSLLCIQFRHDLTLPKRKAELYRRCIETLLRDWDASRRFRRDSAYSSLSDERKERIFEHVAGQYFLEGVRLAFPAKEVEKVVGTYVERFGLAASEAPNILDEIERHHGILEKISVDAFAFSHTSFQEFFVARDLLARRKEMDYIRQNYEDDNWSSVIEFMAALHENAEEIINFLIDQSRMSALKTSYPAMARRTKLLWLIYRCLCSGACLGKEALLRTLNHLFSSQLEMARIYREGGVYPIAVLQKDGVRHSFYYFNKRSTLSAALQPYRMLSNEMLLSPYKPYVDVVLSRINEIDDLEIDKPWAKKALRLCLCIPIAPHATNAVKRILETMIENNKQVSHTRTDDGLMRLLSESLQNLNAHYLPKKA